MDNNKKNKKPVKNELIEDRTQNKEGHRHVENIEKNSSSIITSRFEKKYTRSNRSFGDGHEPGTIPGGGV